MDVTSYIKINDFIDNFEKNKSVESTLLYGNCNCKNKIITIVIPTYGRSKLLYEAIKSAAVQTDPFGFNILIVDNANAKEITEQNIDWLKTQNYSNVLYYKNESNLGVDGNYNRCIELANTKYIAFLHDDDLLCNDYIRVMKRCISRAESLDREIGFIRTRYVEFRNENINLKLGKRFKGHIQQIFRIHSLLSGIGPTYVPSCGMVFSKKAMLDVGGFNSEFYPCGDYIVGYQILLKKYKCFKTKERLGFYRMTNNSSGTLEMYRNFCQADYNFREYMYSENVIHKIFGKIFRETQYECSKRKLTKNANSMGVKIDADAIDIRARKTFQPIRYIFLKIITVFIYIITSRVY